MTTENQVIEYLRSENIKSGTLFFLWLFSIMPCWMRGHRIANKDQTKFIMGKEVCCMKCKKVM